MSIIPAFEIGVWNATTLTPSTSHVHGGIVCAPNSISIEELYLMSEKPTITTKRLTLRPFTLDDAPEVQRLVGDRDIVSRFTGHNITQSVPFCIPVKIGGVK